MADPAATVELVVARHHERVEWTRHVPRAVRVTIYDKGGDLGDSFGASRVVALPNVGREAQTYLQHLVARYSEGLAAATVFCQGHPFDHASDLHRVLRALASGEERVDDFRWLGFIIDTDDRRGRRLFVNWSKNADRRELGLGPFCEQLFDEPAPEHVRFFPGGQFVVSARRVRARPRAFYARALALSERYPDAAHCFERVWDRVFGVCGVDPAVLGAEPCRYLKPIRRLGRRTLSE